MDFSHHESPNTTRVAGDEDAWDSETNGEKSISHGKPYKMYFLAYFTLQGTLVMINTLHKVEDHENHVRWIISQLFSTWVKVRNMREHWWSNQIIIPKVTSSNWLPRLFVLIPLSHLKPEAITSNVYLTTGHLGNILILWMPLMVWRIARSSHYPVVCSNKTSNQSMHFL